MKKRQRTELEQWEAQRPLPFKIIQGITNFYVYVLAWGFVLALFFLVLFFLYLILKALIT